jgi:Putative DNA-binding domain
MLPWNLTDLNEQRLTEVVTNGREESQTLEYKRTMPFGTWEERLKVLKAVSAFANTFGGDLVIGVEAPGGIPQLPIVGIPAAEIDGLKLAFESVARDSLDPSLPAGTVAFKSIPVGSDGQAVLVARIAQSRLGPHRIGRKGDRDFWTRTNAGKEPMTIAQLRDAFVLSGTVREKIRDFVNERVEDLAGYAGGPPDSPIDLQSSVDYSSPQFVLHVLPIAAFARHDFSIAVVRYRDQSSKLAPIATRRHQSILNLNGAATLGDEKSATRGYAQLYRAGILEALQSVPATLVPGSMPPEREMYIGYFERDMRSALSRYISLLTDESIGAPICLYLTLLHASNCRLEYTQEWHFHSPRMVGSNIAVLPEVVVHDISQPEVDKQLKVLFDSLWNCGDSLASPSFDGAGIWRGPK